MEIIIAMNLPRKTDKSILTMQLLHVGMSYSRALVSFKIACGRPTRNGATVRRLIVSNIKASV